MVFAPGMTMARLLRRESRDEPGDTSAAPQSTGDTTAGTPDRDRIATRAYELYLARGGSEGEAMDDWLAAERELRSTGRTSE